MIAKDRPNINKQQIIVLGMHRSGTSMIAGILYHLGIFMGEHLMIEDPDTGPTLEQPHGYYEDREFMGINTHLLTNAKGGWENVPNRGQLSVACNESNPELNKLIKKRNQNHIIWGFKDPRASLTLPAYIHRLKNLKVILIARDKENVVESLLKREKHLTSSKISELYDDYYHHIWSNLSGFKVDYLAVSFEEMIKNSRPYIEEIVGYLELEPTPNQYQKALAHIRPEIRAKARP